MSTTVIQSTQTILCDIQLTVSRQIFKQLQAKACICHTINPM